MKRRPTNRKKDQRVFSRTASRTHSRNLQNVPLTIPRGGHRI
jgi:hypothetical protein